MDDNATQLVCRARTWTAALELRLAAAACGKHFHAAHASRQVSFPSRRLSGSGQEGPTEGAFHGLQLNENQVHHGLRGREQAEASLHIMRHAYCSRLAMRGGPVSAIKDLAGHEDDHALHAPVGSWPGSVGEVLETELK